LIDNVNPPSLARKNSLGIDIDAEYQRMLERVCSAVPDPVAFVMAMRKT